MGITRKKEPTLLERYNAAATTREAALSVFTGVLDDLTAAEAEALAVAEEARDQAAELLAVAKVAEQHAIGTYDKRVQIGKVLGL